MSLACALPLGLADSYETVGACTKARLSAQAGGESLVLQGLAPQASVAARLEMVEDVLAKQRTVGDATK